MQPNGSPLNNSPSTAGSTTNHGPSYASTVKAGTSDDDQWALFFKFLIEIKKKTQQ